MRVAVYNLYWATLGGGEQVAAAIAEHLLDRGHEVTLLGPNEVDPAVVSERLGRDLAACDWVRIVDDDEASAASLKFDLFINCTYLSRAVPRSRWSLYYVHFPGVPPTRRRRLISSVAAIGHRGLSMVDDLPNALAGVRSGLDRRRLDNGWVRGYTLVAANSAFTAIWIDRLWGVEAQVLYPPVLSMTQVIDGGSTVLSLGRFFDRSFGHCKKQDVLLDAWLELAKASGSSHAWNLRLLGGADGASRDYVLDLRRRSQDTTARIEVNVPRSVVEEALRSSSIFWHAGGFGEDPDRHPDRFEHFGIAVVEAMAAGCVPIVYAAAGPAEIVRDGIDGFHWRTRRELIERTESLIRDDRLRERMSRAAIERAGEFSGDRFRETFDRLLDFDVEASGSQDHGGPTKNTP